MERDTLRPVADTYRADRDDARSLARWWWTRIEACRTSVWVGGDHGERPWLDDQGDRD